MSGVSHTSDPNSTITSIGSSASSPPGFPVPGLLHPGFTFPFQDVNNLPHVPQPGEHREYSFHSHPSPAMGKVINNHYSSVGPIMVPTSSVPTMVPTSGPLMV